MSFLAFSFVSNKFVTYLTFFFKLLNLLDFLILNFVSNKTIRAHLVTISFLAFGF